MAKILIKRSDVAGFVPDNNDLSIGELQLNTTDGKLFMKRSVLSVESMVEVGKDAATAVKLMTGRKINGTVFDGTQDISFGTNSVVEESNLYYTQARFDAAFGNKTTNNLFEGTNLYYTQARFNAAFAAKTTNDLTEGSNLYYTNARASAAAPVQTVAGRTGNVVVGLSDVVNAMNKTGDTMTGFLTLSANPTANLHAATKIYVDAQISSGTASSANKLTTARNINNTLFDGTQDISFSTDKVAEGFGNLYYTQARFDAALAAKTTTNLTEGTNLYYTNARASAAAPVQTVFGRNGAVVLTSNDVVTALGYVPTNSSGAGTPGGAATLDANGKLLSSQIPAIAVTDTYMAASEAEMLALTNAETGDVAIRTDLSKSFILKAMPYSTLANWQELLTPSDVVQSVAGKVGTVLLAVTDVSGAAPSLSPAFTGIPTAPTASAGTNNTQVATTAFATSAISTAAAAALVSPTFTGVPKAPTATTSDNSTQLATTAFVKAQNYATTTGTVTNAETVTNAAQPAITSLGTLTNLSVSGVTNLGTGGANYLSLIGAATGGAPKIIALGSDATSPIIYQTKSDIHAFYTGASLEQVRIGHTANAVNYLRLTGGVTGTGPVLTVDGSDASADLQLSGKNAGIVKMLTPMTVAGTIFASNTISTNQSVIGRFMIGAVSPGMTASGLTQATGSNVINQVSVVTAATAGTNVALTLTYALYGQICYIINTTNVTISVFPQVNSQIDTLGLNNPYSLGPNARLAFICSTAQQWWTLSAVYA